MALRAEVFPDPVTVAGRAADHVVEQAREAVAERGVFTFAVSGGTTPWTMFGRLAGRLPWADVVIYQVDERIAPAGDHDRNLTHLLASLPPSALGAVHAMPVEAEDVRAAAAEYDAALPDRLDLVHLGLGADGHTASLVPGDPVLEVADRGVAVTGEYEGRRRMTLTYPTLERARQILWLVTGEDKVDALRRLREGDRSIPAGRVPSEHALLFADAAAAGRET